MINPRRREIEEDFKAKQLGTGKSKLETFICDIEIEMGHLLPHQVIFFEPHTSLTVVVMSSN